MARVNSLFPASEQAYTKVMNLSNADAFAFDIFRNSGRTLGSIAVVIGRWN